MTAGVQVRDDRDLNWRAGEQMERSRQVRGNSKGGLGD